MLERCGSCSILLKSYMVTQAVSSHLHVPFQLVACPSPLPKYFKTEQNMRSTGICCFLKFKIMISNSYMG